MYKTVYFESRDFDGDTLIRALPNGFVRSVDEWTTEHIKELASKSGTSKGVKYSVFHTVFLVDQVAINGLKNYVRPVVHRDVFPHSEYHVSNKLFVRLTPDQKKVFDRVVKSFCKALQLKDPLYLDFDKYAFVEFAKADFVPQLLGLLRAYDELSEATLSYAKPQKPRPHIPKSHPTIQPKPAIQPELAVQPEPTVQTQ